jgi:hypothetical protein
MATSRLQVKTLHSYTEMCSAEREREKSFFNFHNLGSSHSSCWYSYRM